MGIGITFAIGNFMTKSDYDPDENGKIVELVFDYGVFPRICPHGVRKVASDDLRHSIDAPITNNTGATAWRKDKTLVFTNGIKGTLRMKLDIKGQGGNNCAKLTDKDGTLLGALLDPTNGCAVATTHSQDIAIDFAPGGEIQVWSSDNGCATVVENFRVYYVNDATATPDAVAVTGAD